MSATTDAWSCGSLSCVALTNHYVDTTLPVWSLEHSCLHVAKFEGSHTAEALGAFIDAAVDGIHMGKEYTHVDDLRMRFWAGVADGAAAQQKAFQFLGNGFSIWQFWCICHVIHLAVKGTMADCPDMIKVIAKMKKLVSTVRNSTLLNNDLTKINDQLGNPARCLVLDVVTRWTSTHSFVSHAVENKDALFQLAGDASAAVAKAQERNQRNQLKKAGLDELQIDKILSQELEDSSVTNQDWEVATMLEKSLKPVYIFLNLLFTYYCVYQFINIKSRTTKNVQIADVSQKLEADKYATLGLVIPLLVNLFEKLDENIAELKKESALIMKDFKQGTDKTRAIKIVLKFVEKFKYKLKERINPFLCGEENAPYLAATFLLPGLNKFSFFTDANQRETALETAKEQVLADMQEVSLKPFVPKWAMGEQDYYKKVNIYVCNYCDLYCTLTVFALYFLPLNICIFMLDVKYFFKVVHPIAIPAVEPAQQINKKQRKNEWGMLQHDEQLNEAVVDAHVRPTNEAIVELYMNSNPFQLSECQDPTNTKKMLEQLRNLVFGPRGSIDNTLLLRVALRYFCSPASSAPTERVWSSATNTFTKNRRSFNGDNFATTLYVNCNQHRVKIE